jgi:hypothetical protein
LEKLFAFLAGGIEHSGRNTDVLVLRLNVERRFGRRGGWRRRNVRVYFAVGVD